MPTKKQWVCALAKPKVPDYLQALIQCEILIDLEPLLSVPHVGDVELSISNVFEPGKFRFKVLRNSMRTRAVVLRAEVEASPKPFPVNVHDVIPLRILRGRFDEVRLQEGLYELISFLLDFSFQIIRHLGLSGGIYPSFGWHGGPFFTQSCRTMT